MTTTLRFKFIPQMSIAMLLVGSLWLAIAQADLRSDLKDFRSIIPRRRIGYLAARHFIIDPQFRIALDYVRGQKFPDTWQAIRNTTEVDGIVAYVQKAARTDYDVTQLVDRIPNRVRSFQIPSKVPVELMIQRNLNSFLNEVVTALPRGRIASLISRKVKEDGEFAQIYKAMRKDEFRKLVDAARKSPNLEEPIAELTKHHINVDKLIETGFTVLSWGP